MINPKIAFPIKNARPGAEGCYALIFEDNNNVTHYFDVEGQYDGYSHDPCIDADSGTCLN